MPKPQASQDLPRLANPCPHTAGTPFLADGWMDGWNSSPGWTTEVTFSVAHPGVFTGPAELVSHLSSGCSSLLPGNQAPLKLVSLTSCCLKYTSSIRVTPETSISHNILLLEGLTKLCYPGLASNFGSKPFPCLSLPNIWNYGTQPHISLCTLNCGFCEPPS